jgi:Rrf2 family protein
LIGMLIGRRHEIVCIFNVARVIEKLNGCRGELVSLRLELSSEGRYALRALVFLAWIGERVTADRISAEARIPRRLLARILAKLSHAGLVESEQGRGGGSRLARPANKITLREAVEAVEGPFGVTNCIMEDRACREGSLPCAFHDAWEKGQQAILEYLGTQTIEEFISQTASDKLPLKNPKHSPNT